MSTSTLTHHFTQRNLEILFRATPAPRNAEAWHKMIGEKPIGARLDVLPERRTNWRALATSTFAEAGVVVALLLLQILMPPSLAKIEYEVIPLAGPMVEIPTTKTKPAAVKMPPQPIKAPQPLHVAKLFAPRLQPPPPPKPAEARPADVPKVEQAAMLPKLDVPEAGPVKPREVKTGVLGDSPAGGGFGDPRGLPGAADPSKRVNIAHIGAFDFDNGPGVGSGSGNSTGAGGSGGGGNGNGVVPAGFGGGAAIASGKSSVEPRVVEKSGFQNAEAVPQASAKPKAAAQAAPPTAAAAILSKPNPVYTDEARRLGIEGEVLVDVVFLATGQVKVEGVEKGLGHGLDEAAIRAAQQIRFKPAMQEGQAVDFPATVHILFQLAF